ncbi:MAG TPA: M15 family metallopeptidase [Polyangiaceae bacterium]|nr:M15 family metallopeptidase [Polyangiaceae bacterium]
MLRPRPSRFAVLCTLIAALTLAAMPGVSAAERTHGKPPARKSCPTQKPQPFLIRSNFVKHGALNAAAHEQALRYRAEQYGSVEGLGLERYNKQKAYASAVSVRFMGLPLQIHKKIAPALRCVERYLERTCTGPKERYTPRAIGGFRQANTYRGGEVSNHLFGIAIDIDPNRNPCCGCVAPWPDHPACRSPAESVFERAALPRCWIDGFERFGFYWLGRDPELRDTMHFEFLGDPERLAAQTSG